MKSTTRLARGVMALLLCAPAAALAAPPDGGNLGGAENVDGLTVYLGVTPASMIRTEYSKQSPEMRMHGGPPPGNGQYHVMIAVFNENTGTRVTDASVSATVREVGLSGQTKPLQPMTIAGDTTYGNYFDMSQQGQYRIEFSIQRPGAPAAAHAEFDYDRAVAPSGGAE